MDKRYMSDPIKNKNMLMVYNNIKIDDSRISEKLKNATRELQEVIKKIALKD